MESMTAAQAKAWHLLFASAPLEALDQALEADAVPPGGVLDGQDLLFTLLARPCAQFEACQAWWGEESSGNPVAHVGAIVRRLLARAEVDPFRPGNARQVTGPGWSQERVQAEGTCALALALAGNLGGAVRQMAQWAGEHGREAAFQARLAQPLEAGIGGAVAGLDPMAAAVRTQRGPLVRVLAGLGVDPNATDAQGRTLLFQADHAEVVQALLDAGADPAVRWNGADLLTHWAARARRGNRSNPYGEMIRVLERHAPHLEQGRRVPDALAWFSTVEAAPNPYDSYSRDEAKQIKKRWVAGWKSMMAPALTECALHAMAMDVPSGLRRGRATAASELGWVWLHDTNPHALKAGSCHLALMDDPTALLGAEPATVRAGVEDWGVLALGACVHLAHRPEVKPPGAASVEPSGVALVNASQARLRSLIVERMGVERFDQALIAAGARLGRPRNPALWGSLAHAWQARLDLELGLAGQGLGLGVVGQDTSMEARQRRALGLARRGAQAGIRWLGPLAVALMDNLAQASLAAHQAQPGVEQTQALEDVLVAGLCLVADIDRMRGTGVSGKMFVDERTAGELGRQLAQVAQAMDSMVPMDASMQDRMAAGVKSVRRWAPELDASLAQLRMEGRLPSAGGPGRRQRI